MRYIYFFCNIRFIHIFYPQSPLKGFVVASQYSEDQKALIVNMWQAGHHTNVICERLETDFGLKRSTGAISTVAGRWGLAPRHRKHRRQTTHTGEPVYDLSSTKEPRKCLRCSGIFPSAHKGNRICGLCKTSNEYDGIFYSGDTETGSQVQTLGYQN